MLHDVLPDEGEMLHESPLESAWAFRKDGLDDQRILTASRKRTAAAGSFLKPCLFSLL